MEYQDKTVIIFDLDDTLAESKRAPDVQMNELLASLAAKKAVAVMSGGSLHQFKSQLLSSLPLAGEALKQFFILPASGASLYRFEHGDWHSVYEEHFSAEESARVIEALQQAADECGGRSFELFGKMIEDRGSQVTFSGLGMEAPLERKHQWDPDHAKRACMREKLLPKLEGFEVNIGGTTSVDVTKKGVDKAYGVRKLSELLNIPISEMLYVGDALYDGGNDAVVKETGIDCKEVSGVEDTKQLIREILS